MKKTVSSTGKPLDLDDQEHCSVVINTDTMKMKIEGKFRQRERKLYILLVHAIWDELGSKRKYTVETSKLKQVLNEVAGIKEFNTWLWDYLKNLARIEIEYECDSLKGITRLFSEVTFDDVKERITFEIPQTVEEAILKPNSFARLDTYFLLGLKGKYSVSLYQLLESKINLRKFDPNCTPDSCDRFVEISIEDLRGWLALENQYPRWIDFKRFALEPAINEINSNPLATTFNVRTEEVTGARRKVKAIRFFLTKTEERLELEKSIQTTKQAKEAANNSFLIKPFRGTEVYEKAKELAPHHDIYQLESEWREYAKNQDEAIASPEAAFLGFIKKRAQEQPQKLSNAFMSLFRKT